MRLSHELPEVPPHPGPLLHRMEEREKLYGTVRPRAALVGLALPWAILVSPRSGLWDGDECVSEVTERT